MLLQPQELEVTTQAGEKRTYILSKFPAIAGREIISKYPTSNVPKLGDYQTSEEVMVKLMGYVAIPRDSGEPLPLSTRALIDNHIPDWETLIRIEFAMMEYNCSFFANGKASTFFEAITQKAQAFLSQTLMDLSAQSSAKVKQR